MTSLEEKGDRLNLRPVPFLCINSLDRPVSQFALYLPLYTRGRGFWSDENNAPLVFNYGRYALQ